MNAYSRITLVASTLSFAFLAEAQTPVDNGVTFLSENLRPKERVLLEIPDIGDYVTLKCDLHMHTVFSDGLVWPTVRIAEAWQEGLDAVSITDHLEYQRYKEDIPIKHNRPYELSQSAAEWANLLLVHGNEITRDTPPGHFNAIFIKDGEELYVPKEEGNLELDRQAIDKAVSQDAFIFWNHPGWRARSIEGSYEWIPFVDQLNKEGKLDGIEVINGFSFHRKALDWALENGLTIMGSSDIHDTVANAFDMEKGVRRTMTLVFAKERSLDGLREALEAGRTVAWSTRLIAGREKWIRALYDASIRTGKAYSTDPSGNSLSEITNTSDLYFDFKRVDPGLTGWPETISLNPRSSQILKIKSDPSVKSASYEITNAFIGGDRNLVVELTN